jgi:hypothetical protein
MEETKKYVDLTNACAMISHDVAYNFLVNGVPDLNCLALVIQVLRLSLE